MSRAAVRAKKPPQQPLGPCQAVPGCRARCEGWEPHPTYVDPWQTCACGHSRSVHALDLPPPPEPKPDPAPEFVTVCPCCRQPLLPEESDRP